MRKIYTSALFACISTLAVSQSFFVPTDYRGAFAPAPTAMWTDGWANWDPQNTSYNAPTVTVTASITNNTTWTSNNVYLLSGPIYVKNGATLTIQPGTVILGDKAVQYSGLYITQGSKLEAQGTESQPIVFSSNQAAGARAKGDWGGIILMGRASNNQPGGIANIEGIAPSADTQYGGGTNPDDNDNSGTLSYVRIEFCGQIFQTDKEINGLTMGAVGKGTQLDHIQVSFSNDDAYEWFGGTVNARYLVSYRNLDDDFDTDNGYSGNVQFGLIVRDPNIADNPSVSTSEGFESDNDATGSAATPKTSAIFSNITAIGPFRGNTAATIATGYRRGARIRRNSSISIYNTIFMDFKNGLYLDNTNPGTEANATAGTLRFRSNLVAGNTPGKVTEKLAVSTFPITTFFATNNNDSLAATTGILITPYDYLAPDYRPTGSLADSLETADFADAVILPHVLTAPAVGSATQSYCQDDVATQLSATATNGNTLNWYTQAQGGSASTTAPTPTTTTAGTFNFYVSQMNADGFEGPRSLITITVNALPASPTINAGGPTSFCTGGSVDLTASSATSYDWTNNATTQVITVSTSGNYSVTITDANGCEATSSAVTVNVSNAPEPTVQIVGSTELCQGETVTLTASTSDTYTWSNAATTQSIVVSTAGTYSVTTTNADACDGVGQSSNVVVTVTPQPIANGSFVINNFVGTFTNTSTSATTYSWDFGDFTTSSAAAPTHAFAASGAYTVTLTAINGNCSDDTTFTINIVVGLDELSAINNAIVYPNPLSDNAILSVELANETAMEVVIMNANGQFVQTIATGNFEAGKHQMTIDATTFAQGLYYTVIRTNESTQTIKFSVVK